MRQSGADIGYQVGYSRKGSPTHGIEAHIDVQHGSHGLASGRRINVRIGGGRVGFFNRSDDEEERAHSDGRDEERQLATERLDKEEHEEDRRDKFDDSVDTGSKQRSSVASISDLTIQDISAVIMWDLVWRLTEAKICGA